MRRTPTRSLIAMLALACHAPVEGPIDAAADAAPDAERPGPVLVAAGGRVAAVTEAFLVSTSNDNASFLLSARCDAIEPRLPAALVLGDDEELACDSAGGSGDQRWFSCLVADDAVDALAARLGIEVHRREHPGHALAASFEVPRTRAMDGKLVLTFVLENTGTVPVSFHAGGRYRGSGRNNRFAFRATSPDGTVLTDEGNPYDLGGLSSEVTLAPGEPHREEVDLRSWFSLRTPGDYAVEASYTIAVRRAPAQRESARPGIPHATWIELLCWDEVLSVLAVVRVDG